MPSQQPVHKHHDETQVERTTPQGTQEAGVERGHEDRDMNIRVTMSWFIGLAVAAGIIHLVVWGMFALFAWREDVKDEPLRRAPLLAEQTRPPEPLLLPEPWEAYKQERQAENKKLARYGLADPKTGQTKLSAAADQVIQEGQRTGTQGTKLPGQPGQPMRALPHDASGGRTLERSEQ